MHILHILQFDWFPENSTEYQLGNYRHYKHSFFKEREMLRYRSRCQDDIFPRIELFPLSSCQVIILIARMTFNCSTSCLRTKCLQRLSLTPPGVKSEANSRMTIHSLVLISDSFSCNCNSIQSPVSIVHLRVNLTFLIHCCDCI